MDAGCWTIPASRMKAGREFTVPLSTGALQVLERARKESGASRLVFPSRTGRRLPATASLRVLRARRCRLDTARLPFERPVVDGGVQRPGGSCGDLPCPCAPEPSRAGVSAVRSAEAARRSPPGMERLHQVAKLLPRRLVSTHIPGGPVRQPVAQLVVVGLLLSVLNRIRCGSTETAPPVG